MKAFNICFVLICIVTNFPSVASTKPRYFNRTAENELIGFFQKRTVYRSKTGTAIFERFYRDRPNDYLFYGRGGKFLVKSINGQQIISYKGYYNNLNLNIEFLVKKNNTLLPLRGWISSSNIYYVSDSVLADCSNTPSPTLSIKKSALALITKLDKDDLVDSVTDVFLEDSCANSVKKNIATAFMDSLITQANEKSFFDCLDNPETFTNGEKITENTKADFAKVGNSFATILADIDSNSNSTFSFSCVQNRNAQTKPIRFSEGNPSKVEIFLENNKTPESLHGEKLTEAIYHELIHFGGVADDKKVDAIMGLCYSKNSSKLSDLQKEVSLKDDNSLNAANTDFTPPWDADPKANIKIADESINTSNLPSTQPIVAPTANQQKAISVLYNDDTPALVKTEAARIATQGLGDTFNGIKQFAHAVMATAVPSAIASQTIITNGSSSSFHDTADTNYKNTAFMKSNDRKSNAKNGMEEYTVKAGTTMKPGTAIKLSFKENTQSESTVMNNPNMDKTQNVNRAQHNEVAKTTGRTPTNEGPVVYADVGNSAEFAKTQDKPKSRLPNNVANRNASSITAGGTTSPFTKMTADEMTSFLKHSKVKIIKNKIADYEAEFDQKLNELNISVKMSNKRYGPKAPHGFIQKGESLVEFENGK